MKPVTARTAFAYRRYCRNRYTITGRFADAGSCGKSAGGHRISNMRAKTSIASLTGIAFLILTAGASFAEESGTAARQKEDWDWIRKESDSLQGEERSKAEEKRKAEEERARDAERNRQQRSSSRIERQLVRTGLRGWNRSGCLDGLHDLPCGGRMPHQRGESPGGAAANAERPGCAVERSADMAGVRRAQHAGCARSERSQGWRNPT